MKILGISAFYHDSAAAVICDGQIVAAAQEERFSRKKNDSAFPKQAIEYCLREADRIDDGSLDYIAFYDQPFLVLDRFVHSVASLGKDATDLINLSYDNLLGERLWIHDYVKGYSTCNTKLITVKHHISHAASAFFPSPYNKSIILTMDGVGEWSTLSIGMGLGNKIELKEELRYPHSLGLFYSAFSYFCGFKVNSGEYKFMGLAPYGEPVYYDMICKNIIDVKEDGSFFLNMEYFDYEKGTSMINEKKMGELFGGKRRIPESKITRREMNIAASVQKITTEIIIKIAKYAKKKYGTDIKTLVMAGGVALNCAANGCLRDSNVFEDIWIQPAAGDAGGALGAALYIYYQVLDNNRIVDDKMDLQQGSLLGPEYTDEFIKDFLETSGYRYHILPSNKGDAIADLLDQGMVIGLFHGKMEFGPRALGNRSIIADPRQPQMQERMNIKIKNRESFRPFAPIVLEEQESLYFVTNKKNPYMLFCSYVNESIRVPQSDIENPDDLLAVIRQTRSTIPAVTHIDYSARIQTVNEVDNPYVYDILKSFERKTGCGVLINTSFNVRGEPIVCSPQDAYYCFINTDMDILILNGFILYKSEQNRQNCVSQVYEYD